MFRDIFNLIYKGEQRLRVFVLQECPVGLWLLAGGEDPVQAQRWRDGPGAPPLRQAGLLSGQGQENYHMEPCRIPCQGEFPLSSPKDSKMNFPGDRGVSRWGVVSPRPGSWW